MDIKGGKCNADTEICQWKSHDNLNQQWLVIPADNIQPGNGPQEDPDVPEKFVPEPKTHYKITSVMDEDKCLTVKDGKAELGTFNGGKNQIFDIHV